MFIRRFDFDQVESTQQVARELAGQHPGEILLITAATQSAGRGRFDRMWQSPRGGLWMSLVLPSTSPQTQLPGDDAPQRAAMAVYRCILNLVGDPQRVALKQPNDVLVEGQKIAGVLCERTLCNKTTTHLIVGVGINANFEAEVLNTDDLRYPATSLQTVLGRAVDLAALRDRLAEQLRIECHALRPT